MAVRSINVDVSKIKGETKDEKKKKKKLKRV